MFSNLKSIKTEITDVVTEAKTVKRPSNNSDSLLNRSFANWLTYSAYLEDEKLFINDDSVGFVLEFSPQSGSNEEMAKLLSSIYPSCPPDTGVQIQLLASPDIKGFLKNYVDIRISDDNLKNYLPKSELIENENPFREIAKRRAEFFNKATATSFAPSVGSLVRDFKGVVSITVKGDASNSQFIENLLRIRSSIESVLLGASFPCKRFNAEDLIKWCSFILNPPEEHNFPWVSGYDSTKELKHQIIKNDTRISVRTDKIFTWNQVTEKHKALRILTVKNYPKFYALSQMHSLIGDALQSTLQFACPFLLTLGVYVQSRDSIKTKVQLRQARATQNAGSPLARFMPAYTEQKRDWDLALKIVDDGETLVEMYHTVMLISDKDNIDDHDQKARAVWASKGFDMAMLDMIQLPALMISLPMCLTKEMYDDIHKLKLTSTKTTVNAVNMSPMIAEWKGTPTPVMMFAGRRGQIVGLDLFDNTQGNYNVAIAGASGSGKSVFVNDIASSYSSTGAKVWIIDVGRSYINLCEAFSGDFIDFSYDKNIIVNPFTFISNINEEMELLHPLIALMASPKQELDNFTYAVVGRAIKKVWDTFGNKSTITDIYNLVKQGKIDEEDVFDQRIQDLASLLYLYTKHGSYGRYFEGDANISFKNRFTVLELEELNTKKDLRTIILFIMMFRITNDMYLSDRAQRKIVIIDEAWDLLGAQGGDSNATAKFIDSGYRRARKYGGSFITATQNISDYEMSAAASSALKNSDWRCMLRQKSETLDQMKNKSDADLPLLEALKSLRTEKDVFSEILLSGYMGKAIVRLYMDPYNLLRSSSNPTDFTEVKKRRDKGMSLHAALLDVLKSRNQL